MPINTRPNQWHQSEYVRAEDRLDENVCLDHWYSFAGPFVKDKVALDFGCGTGGGVQILKQYAREAYGFDPQPQVKSLVDISLPNSSYLGSKTFDVVLAIDVIEHVKEDVQMVKEMVRLAKEMIILTTPNWCKNRCQCIYHYREYTYGEWKDLFEQFQYKHFYGYHTKVVRLPISANNHHYRAQGIVVWLNK